MNRNKLTAVFCLATGILNLGMWTILIITGQVPRLSEQLVSYLFHWGSEFATAILLIIAGIYSIRAPRHPSAVSLFFLSSGFLITAINGAFWYYLINFNLPVLLMSGAVLAIALILAVKNYRDREDVVLLAGGTVLYGTINFLGYGFDRGDTSLLIYTFPMLIAVIVVLLLKTGRRIQMN